MTHYTTSKPFMDYLLCDECELLLSRRGENWVARNCCRGKRFRIREALYAYQPDAIAEGIAVFRAALIPEIDTEQLSYFAISVFWRAGVHTWTDGRRQVRIDLGPYLEPIRLFLRDETPLPDNMTLTVRVSSLNPCLRRVATPESRNASGYRLHQFVMMGITFTLEVGGIVDGTKTLCTYPSPDRFIGFAPETDL
jgi:hypothetical protein